MKSTDRIYLDIQNELKLTPKDSENICYRKILAYLCASYGSNLFPSSPKIFNNIITKLFKLINKSESGDHTYLVKARLYTDLIHPWVYEDLSITITCLPEEVKTEFYNRIRYHNYNKIENFSITKLD